MNEIITYSEPLSDDEFKEHNIKNLILLTPIRYHLIDVIKALKFGRPAENQKLMNEWITEMESSIENSKPFT